MPFFNAPQLPVRQSNGRLAFISNIRTRLDYFVIRHSGHMTSKTAREWVRTVPTTLREIFRVRHRKQKGSAKYSALETDRNEWRQKYEVSQAINEARVHHLKVQCEILRENIEATAIERQGIVSDLFHQEAMYLRECDHQNRVQEDLADEMYSQLVQEHNELHEVLVRYHDKLAAALAKNSDLKKELEVAKKKVAEGDKEITALKELLWESQEKEGTDLLEGGLLWEASLH